MKTSLLHFAVLACAFLFALSPGEARAQAAATLSQAEAVRLYPALSDADSKFHKKFIQKFQYAKAQSDPRLNRDDWPMIIAAEVGQELNIEPSAAPAATAYVNPLSAAANPTHWIIEGKVIQRLTSGNIIECGGGKGQQHAEGMVFIRDGNSPEGKAVKLKGVEDGTYIYKDADRLEHVVTAYKLSR